VLYEGELLLRIAYVSCSTVALQLATGTHRSRDRKRPTLFSPGLPSPTIQLCLCLEVRSFPLRQNVANGEKPPTSVAKIS
jgi:hypothetical protein